MHVAYLTDADVPEGRMSLFCPFASGTVVVDAEVHDGVPHQLLAGQ